MTQSDVVGLLTVGSAAAPKETLKIGDAGKTQLVEVKEEGEKGLSTYFEKNKQVFSNVLGPNGLPPLPASMHLGTHNKTGAYSLIKDKEQTYGPEYVSLCCLESGREKLTREQIPVPNFHISIAGCERSE